MFTRIVDKPADTVTITFEGRELQARKGLSVAAALLEHGVGHFRNTPVSNSPRAPYCMMGVCFDCLVVIDGIANCQACLIEVLDGMRISRQTGDGGAPVHQALPNEGA